MKNVTLSADEDLIEKARSIARTQRKTLNTAFREWLVQFTSSDGDARNYHALMKNLRHIRAGRHFPREEMNER
jgi:predicted transcriptional regulator